MAKILILTHEYDLYRDRHFVVRDLAEFWVGAGHDVVLHEGARDVPTADIAILHVDCTVVPREYLDAVADVPIVLNRATADIGKRTYSENLVGPYDDYVGPVIVKTNLNSGGVPEWLHASVAEKRGTPMPGPPSKHMTERYPIYPSFGAVPPAMRLDPELVVEKFLPERDPRGYASRHYLFFGDRERCTRIVGPHPVIKGADTIERTMVEVPDEIRAWRKKLGFDFGKLDFVMHEGRPVLIDANRTPTLPRGDVGAAIRKGLGELAGGIAAFLR